MTSVMIKTKEIKAPARLDAAGADMLTHQLDEAIHSGLYELDVCMADTTFLSSAGIRILLMYYQRLKKLGGGLLVTSAGENILKVLELSGLLMLTVRETSARQDSQTNSAASIRVTRNNGMEISLEKLKDAKPSLCEFTGNALIQEFEPAGLRAKKITPGLCGVGIGAFGKQGDNSAELIGEWMAVCGVAISLPPDSGVPDYMIASETLQPDTQLLYAACFPSDFTHSGRFHAQPDSHEVLIGDILSTALEWSESPLTGFVLTGETTGLIGAAMTKPPKPRDKHYFTHPDIRDNLSLTPEPEHAGDIALVSGVISKQEPGARAAKFLRLIDKHRGIWGHLHASVFSFRATPSGRINPGELARDLVENEKLLSLIHLLNDERPLTGLGQSAFRNGVIWTIPLTEEPET